MNSNLDPHIQLEEWLVDGAANDPPREMAFHASMCDECLSRLNAFDSLSAVDVGAAGSPPPLLAPTRVVVGLAWARLATAAAGGILALILVVAGASQLIGFVGHASKPDASLVAVASATEVAQTDGGPIGTFGPSPATEPSPSTGPTPSPIPTFIPLPSVAPQAAPIAKPNAPSVYVQSVSQTTITIRWTSSSYGGPVQKWEIWRTQGGGQWLKQGELGAGVHSLSQSGLYMNTVYHYRLRAVNTSGLSGWSNWVAPWTLPPTPTPTPAPTPPPAPNGLAGTPSCEPPSVVLSWNAVSGVNHYDVYRMGAGVIDSPSSTSSTDLAVACSTTYEYWVVAVTSGGLSSVASTHVFVTTPDPTPTPTPTPTAPSSPIVGSCSGGTGTMSFDWFPPSSDGGSTLSGYHVFVDGSPVSTQSGTSYTDPLAAPGVYTFSVSAYNAFGESGQVFCGPVTVD